MADLSQALSELEEALEAGRHLVPADELAPIVEMASAARKRHGFLGDTVVLALAGGTGSGKSSLLNAIAGANVSQVGAVRPTTAEPLAWIPANPEPGLIRLLDDLGLERRVGHNHELPVAIVDLPDYDSVEFAHRARVEELIPRVDAVVWVLDPQKYSDRALHRDYLIPLAGYAGQFLFVLNQIDRLDDAGLAAVLEDLGRRLRSQGYGATPVATTAARPTTGAAGGIDALVEHIARRFEAKRTAHAKLLEDVRRAHRKLATSVGFDEPGDSSPAEKWAAGERSAVAGLADLVAGRSSAERAEEVGERLATARAAGPIGRLGAMLRRSRLGRALGAGPDQVSPGEWWAQPGLERVVGGLSRTVTDVSTDLGGTLGRQLRADLAPEQLETELRAAVEGARHEAGALGPPDPKWWWSLVGGIQLLVFAALVGGIAWVWVDGVDRGEFPWNLVLVGGSIVIGSLIGLVTRSSGRRAGRRMANEHRATIERALTHQLDERIGSRVVGAVSVRERLWASLERLERTIGSVAPEDAGLERQ